MSRVIVRLEGQRFGRLLVLSLTEERRRKKACWLCRCDCGKDAIVPSGQLRSGMTRSCGCLRAEVERTVGIKHGMNKTPEHRAWVAMRERVNNPNHASYSYYGGKGIKICERWDDFRNFFEDMGPHPFPKATLDRWPNPAGNYEPSNCRWATRQQQSENQCRFMKPEVSNG